ncbi:MAG: methylglyoxal synthase [Bacteroidales bacterium]|nr:methylglyoxal synthase [Bacteroidales bacterium]MDD4575388.1 methylglyoxal synthase [Bacteroidales bacterium]
MTLKIRKTIALVAHDNRKKDLAEWVEWNHEALWNHPLVCTGTTGLVIEKVFSKLSQKNKRPLPAIEKLKSGPLGGDQQLGAKISEMNIDFLIFLWDPMEPQPHDVDVKALLRIATLYNIPVAINRSSADFIISSSLFATEYEINKPDYASYINRKYEKKKQ